MVFTVPDCHGTKTSSYSTKRSLFNPTFLTAKSLYDAFYGFNTLYLAFMTNFTACDFNYTPLITFCKPTPSARHWSLSHQISPSGRERRKVKSLCSECGDLWTLWPVHTWVSVCVTVCDSKGLTKECMKSAGTSDNWAICCKVTAEQTPPPKRHVINSLDQSNRVRLS